jgi:pSer/pThr/pTyr-binding forkhead associated (FHA) protein
VTDDDAAFPTLTVSGGPFDGQKLVLHPGEPRTIGSAEDSSLPLDLENLDISHAQVVWDSRGLLITDLDSSTGTYVNGEKIGNDHPLQDGDRVFLGPPGSKQTAKLAVSIPAEAPLPVDVVEQASVADRQEAPARPASPPTPAPATAAPEAQPVPTAPASPPAQARKPEYTSDMPAIESDRAREAPAVPDRPPAPPTRQLKKTAAPRRSLSVPRPAIFGGAAAVIGLVAYLVVRSLQTPPPVLASIVPPKAEAGATVTIAGTGFGSDAGSLTVRFGDAPGKVISAGDSQVAVTIPEGLTGGQNASVSVQGKGGRSNALFLKISTPPKITSLAPEVAMPGDEVVAKGKNLGAKGATLVVGGQTAEILSAEAASLRFRVPDVPATPGQEMKVVVQAAGEMSSPAKLFFGHLPLLVAVKPGRGEAGERVTLAGRGFDASAAGNVVTFAGQPALVFTASASEISVSVPAIGSTSVQLDVPVVVRTQGRASNPGAFTVARPSRGIFLPRFFAAAVPEHPGRPDAFVSTELGPVLLLGGRGDASSPAERAAKVAAALNAAVDAAATRPVSFELRDSSGPAVAIVGSADLLVKVLPEDLAAYDEALEPSLKGRKLQARSLGAFWLALLQDQISLFVTHERPFRVVEATPHGKVLLDLYAEGARRAGPGAGIPQGVVSPLGAGLAKSLREMALSVPAEGQGTPSASVEGTWQGTMDESGVGSKGITLRLSVQGGKLTGGLTTRSGSLAAEVPLKDVAYERGSASLHFVLVSGAQPRYFAGTLQGDTIAGTIRSNATAKDAVGQFSVKYVE